MADPPLLLLPVRLETRWSSAGTDVQLLLRVYPDVVHSDSHERDLTPDEAAWGGYFWSQPTAAQLAAWGQLVSRYGRPRAAWIAHVTDQADPGRPAVGTSQPSAWTRAPRTSVLPDHWVIIGYDSAGSRLFSQAGGPIPVGADGVQLETGLSPAGPDTAEAGLPSVSAGMRWMIDFQAATSAGMAMTVELTATQQQQLDRVIVLGWRAADATAQLAELLDAHHYTDGLGLVPQGTPTNNTPGAPAGYASRSRDDAASLALELGTPDTLDPASDGHLLAAALGLDDAVFARTACAGGLQQQQAGAMNTVLWSATWGYFLSQMMYGSFSYDDILVDDQVRQHFSQFVRARGPLPALRVGSQPYGVLPVMSMALWTPSQDADPAIVKVIDKALPVWEKSASLVPRVTAADATPEQTLLSILGTDAVSVSYAARPLVGGGYFDYIWQYLHSTTIDAAWWASQATAAAASVASLGAASNPLLARAVFAGRHFALGAPLVYGSPLPDGAPLPATANYLTWLHGASGYQAINAQVGYSGAGPLTPLLYLLLRHSALREYATAAYRFAQPPVPPAARLDPELVHVAPGPQSTVWDQLLTSGTLTARPNVAAFLAGLGQLAQVPVTDLELLLAETLDLCTHRLDAWISSFATKRLAELRSAAPLGLYVGGYGWVDNLASGPASSAGASFVHAPSLAHATTAAVLRSGYLAHQGSPGGTPFALDLSSRPARTASQLLDGVRQGQPLGSVLGYRFERGLHEQGLDVYIVAFRRLAPLGEVILAQQQWNSLVAAGQGATGAAAAASARYQALLDSTARQYQLPQAAELTAIQPAVESVAAASVVDGLALDRLYQAGAIGFGGAGLPGTSSPDYPGVVAQLQDLAAAARALSDAMLAETVFQTVQGNPVRAAATLDALGRGEAAPPELEVLRTPRTGIGITQRLVVLFTGIPPAPAGWVTAPRGQAEPILNAWAGQLLGDPARVTCQASFLDPATGAPVASATITLAGLGLCPLDLIYTSDRGLEGGSELAQRLVLAALGSAHAPAGATAAQVSLTLTRDQADVAQVSFAEAVEAAGAIRQVIAARPLTGDDVTTPGTAGATAVPADLSGRASAALATLQSCATALQAATAASQASTGAAQAGTAAGLPATLLSAAALGVPDCVPAADPGTLAAQASAAGTELQRRLGLAAAAGTDLDRLQAVFGGPGFTVLGGFTPASASDLGAAFGASASLQFDDPLAATTWVQRLSRVRDPVSRLQQALTYAEALDAGPGLRFEVAQLPYQPGDQWGGLAGLTGGGKVALIAHAPFGLTLDGSRPVAGLMIDEVTEVVPSGTEKTAVAFPSEDPTSRAPQALLLAVPPDDNPWTQDTIEATLLETLALAEQVRPVDPDALREAGQLLPALYFALNHSGDTISTDFTPAAMQGGE